MYYILTFRRSLIRSIPQNSFPDPWLNDPCEISTLERVAWKHGSQIQVVNSRKPMNQQTFETCPNEQSRNNGAVWWCLMRALEHNPSLVGALQVTESILSRGWFPTTSQSVRIHDRVGSDRSCCKHQFGSIPAFYTVIPQWVITELAGRDGFCRPENYAFFELHRCTILNGHQWISMIWE